MSFENIKRYQKDVVKLIDNSYALNRLSQVYMFSGPRGTGKMEASLYLACKVLCNNGGCLECDECRRIIKKESSHVHIIETESDYFKKSDITDLISDFSLTSDTNEVFIINEFDKVSEKNANVLLKFLEGLHEGCYGILLVSDSSRILPTIKSRCQVVHFNSLDKNIVKDALISIGVNREKANVISLLTYSIDSAKELANNEDITNLINLAKEVSDEIEYDGTPFLTLMEKGRFLLNSDTKLLHNYFFEMLIALQRDKITLLSGASSANICFEIEDATRSIEEEIDILDILLKAKDKLGYFLNIELLYSSLFIDIKRC